MCLKLKVPLRKSSLNYSWRPNTKQSEISKETNKSLPVDKESVLLSRGLTQWLKWQFEQRCLFAPSDHPCFYSSFASTTTQIHANKRQLHLLLICHELFWNSQEDRYLMGSKQFKWVYKTTDWSEWWTHSIWLQKLWGEISRDIAWKMRCSNIWDSHSV